MTQSPYPAFDFPADPQANDIVSNPITGMRYQWRADLGRWVILGDDVGVQLYIQDEAPQGSPPKSLWYDSVRAELKIRYQDEGNFGSGQASSIQWVPVSLPGTEDRSPAHKIIMSDVPPTKVDDYLVNGDFWYDQIRAELKLWYEDGTTDQWVPVTVPAHGVTGSSAFVIISDTPPVVPHVGALWFDSVRTELKVWYEDEGDFNTGVAPSSQWVPVSLPGINESLPIAGGDGRPPILSPAEPAQHPDYPGEPLKVGDFWIDTSDNPPIYYALHVWDSSAWQKVDRHYLNRYGDKVIDAAGDVDFEWNQKTTLTAPEVHLHSDQSIVLKGSTHTVVEAKPTDNKGFYYSEVEETDTGKSLVNKEYVNDEDNKLLNLIIELEEEIDAIAPSVERGTWKYNGTQSTSDANPGPGYFYLQKKESGFAANIVATYGQANQLIIHNENADGELKDLISIASGLLLQMYDVDDKDFILGEIVSVEDLGGFCRFTLTGVDSGPEVGAAPEDEKLSRLNIFQKPTAGNTYEFVKKSGDKMSGTLHMVNEGDATDLDLDVLKANINFRTVDPNDATNTKDVTIYQNGFNESLSISGDLVVDGSYFSKTGKFYGANPGGQDFNPYNPYIELEVGEGALMWDSEERLEWTAAGVTIIKPVDDTADATGFTIEGATVNDYSSEDPADVVDQSGELLSVYHNGNAPDAINYRGKIVNPKNIVTKEYVDGLGGANNYYQDTPPLETADLQFSDGDLWIDSTDLTGYVWAETAWAQMSLDGQGGGGGGNAPTIIYADAMPVEDPAKPFISGTLWIRSTDLSMFTWATTVWAQVK